jgi:NAD(P)-dependent dehydrogenase (short-subunit alcohol dehydrogenase family)
VDIVSCTGDITDSGFVRSLPTAAVERFGGLDVLINCAGTAQNQRFEEVTEEDYDRIMNLNARAPYFLCQASLPALRCSACATIINITSVVAHKGYPYQSAYAASKHALAGFSKSLANEVYQENIRVHLISPGGVYTPMVAQTRPDLTPDMVSLPEDIANIAAFYLQMRDANAIVDEIQVHRSGKEPFS